MGQKVESYTDEHGNIVQDDDVVTLNGKDYTVAYISHEYVNLRGDSNLSWRHQPFSKGIPNLKDSAKPTGPVRTVTRKEIVPGVYGLVTVESRVGGCRLALPRDNFFCAENVDELRAAIATLTEIADAMEDK